MRVGAVFVVLPLLGFAHMAHAQEAIPAPAMPSSPEPEAAPRRFSYQLSVAPLLGSLVGIPAYGGNLSALFGAASPDSALFGGISGFFGRTEHGLVMTHVRGTFLAEGHFDRLILGAGGELGMLLVDRTTSDQGMTSPTLGLIGFVGADLVQWGNGSSLFVGLSPSVHSLLASDTGPPLFFDGALQVGYQR